MRPLIARTVERGATRACRPSLALALIPAVLGSAFLASLAPAVGAQSVPERGGFVGVTFKSASAYEDGYIHGNVVVDYSFRVCSGMVSVHYGVRAGSAQGSTTYWYKGHNYGVPPNLVTPQSAPFTASVRVSYGATVISEADRQPYATHDLSCAFGSQWITLGPVSKFDPNAKSQRELQDVLNNFTFNIGITRNTMRSTAVESYFARELAAAEQRQRDSVSRARAAELKRQQDSVTAARMAAVKRAQDSVARAATVRQAGSTAASSSGTRTRNAVGPTAGAASPAANASSTAVTYGTVNASSAPSAADRARQRQADSIADAQERQRRIAAMQAQLAAQQAAQQAQNEQLERDVTAATQAVGQLVSGILADRREANERKRERQARAAALAREARQKYTDEMRVAHLRRPSRPACSGSDVPSELTIGQKVTGALTGNECELPDSTSAVLYTFEIKKPMKVELKMASSGMNGRLTLTDSTGRYVRGGAIISERLEAGRYTVTAHSEVMGETGTYSLSSSSKLLWGTSGWQISAAMHSASTAITWAGNKETGSGIGYNGRVGYGFNDHLAVVALYDRTKPTSDQYNDAAISAMEAGVRWSMQTRWRPTWFFAQYTMGPSKMGSFSTTGRTIAAGFEFFETRQLSLEVLGQRMSAAFAPAGYAKTTYAHTDFSLAVTTRF